MYNDRSKSKKGVLEIEVRVDFRGDLLVGLDDL